MILYVEEIYEVMMVRCIDKFRTQQAQRAATERSDSTPSRLYSLSIIATRHESLHNTMFVTHTRIMIEQHARWR